jgi:NAD(P)-dependent dehydrogenase (short-subunit alcohol dehydrogenase family)
MRNQKSGSIVNISSMTGLYGSGMGAGYGASKGGVISMTKSLARELGFWGVRVNCVAPGSIKTDMTAGLRDAALKAVNDGIALRRMGEPEEVALPNTAKELAELVWENLNEDNKVSLFVRVVPLDGGEAEEIILNKNK